MDIELGLFLVSKEQESPLSLSVKFVDVFVLAYCTHLLITQSFNLHAPPPTSTLAPVEFPTSSLVHHQAKEQRGFLVWFGSGW